MSEKPISPLRQRMIEDMTVRNFVEKTKSVYVRHVGRRPRCTTQPSRWAGIRNPSQTRKVSGGYLSVRCTPGVGPAAVPKSSGLCQGTAIHLPTRSTISEGRPFFDRPSSNPAECTVDQPTHRRKGPRCN
jgi:hypothetical protein